MLLSSKPATNQIHENNAIYMPSKKEFISLISIWPPPETRFWGGVTNFFKGPLIRARDKDILHEAYMSLNLSAHKNVVLASSICTFGGT